MLSRSIDPEQQIDPGLVVDAGVEEHVPHDVLAERRPPEHLRQPAVPAPVVRHGAAAVRHDEPQGRKVAEQITFEPLHERRRIRIEVVRADRVNVRVARAGDVHHGGDVELDHLLVEPIPVPIGERWRRPVAAGRIGIEIAADEAELHDAPLELHDRVVQRRAGPLRQLADAGESDVERDRRPA